ncbi:ATP-binding cassette domain-containing protein [Gulosibacter sp. 10]|uniref:ATP-binding cassette domain-containing protein n=1 Tax=Gulosibacter sp. 10 TaxID=1255570 RepID=UPI00097E9099|nr:ATP-binding cassette domain-containing protein [Gulosibacter sp. 10]SJM55730.1 Excinuclease ABC subunit A paralog of unknown function [Gulosibacter sp. 10]
MAVSPASSPFSSAAPITEISVVGAREHNLADVSVSMPHGALIAICGVSGSGKSSLAFDTVYAEAQRRYLESVSPFTRHLLGAVNSPEVDRITGLPAAIAVKQLVSSPPEHSSVGTLSQVADLLRVLFSRIGEYPPGQGHLLASAFSPNTVEGACPACAAKGSIHEIDVDASVPDPRLSIREGAIAAWPGGWVGLNFRRVAEVLGVDIDAPWQDLPRSTRDWLLTTEETPTVTVHPTDATTEYGGRAYEGRFRSARRYLLDTVTKSGSAAMRERALQFLHDTPCPECGGSRIARAALGVVIGGENIAEVSRRSLVDMARFIRRAVEHEGLPSSGAKHDAARLLLSELEKRVAVIDSLGVGYLAADRSAATLSAGELQRLRLAAHLHSGLHGMLYVFDELSTGLHPADIDHLFAFIEQLRDSGNTVILVEHEMATVRRCDWVVELGPGGGARGGRVMFAGSVDAALAGDASTAERLRNAPPEDLWREPRRFDRRIRLEGVTTNTLDGAPIEFPAGALTTVTGVSGSGKSSLLRSVASLAAASGTASLLEDEPQAGVSGEERRGLAGATASGLDAVSRVVSFDQSAIGRSPRSVIGTYIGIFDKFRSLFAKPLEARSRGYTASRFSFNTAAGRCPRCEGLGTITIDLVHLPASSGKCPECDGRRFTEDTLEIEVDGLNIADVLALSIDAAADRFGASLGAADHFEALQLVGLGGLLLGQSTATLSGGEAQRLRLAAALRARPRREHSLFILDEPMNGLHPSDARVLGGLFQQIVDEGNTVLMADHNMEIAAGSDWLIDLGPGAGPRGGHVVAAGPPREVAAARSGVTGSILAERFLDATG